MKKLAAVKFFVIALLIFTVSAVTLIGFPIGIYNVKSFFSLLEYGLDMRGGVELIYETAPLQEDDDMEYAVSSTMQKQQSRLRAYGYKDAVLTQIDDTRIRIELPAVGQTDEVAEMLAQSGELRFRLASGDVILTGENVQYAVAGYMSQSNVPAVTLQFDQEGTEIFARTTREHMNETLAIYLDEDKIAAPAIGGVITDGVVSITNLPSIEDAEQLAGMISAGELNTTVELVSRQQIESEMTGNVVLFNVNVLLAVLVLVCEYLIWRYGMGGMMAAMTQIVYALIVLMLLLTVGGTVFTMATFPALLACPAFCLVQVNAVLCEMSRKHVKPALVRSAYSQIKKQLARQICGANAALILFGLAMQMESVSAVTTVGRVMIFCGIAGMLCHLFVLGGFLRLGAGMCRGEALCKAGGFGFAGKKVHVKFAWVLHLVFIAAGIASLLTRTDTSRLQMNSVRLAMAIFAVGLVIAAAAAFVANGKSVVVKNVLAVALDMITMCMICAACGTFASSTFALVFVIGAVSITVHVMEGHCVAGVLAICMVGSIAMIFCGAPAMSNLALCMLLGSVFMTLNVYTVDFERLASKLMRK